VPWLAAPGLPGSIDVQCLDIGDDGTGARRGDVVGVGGIAEDRRHLVTTLGQDTGEMQSDFAMPPMHRGADGRLAGDRSRCHRRPPVRVEPAVGALRCRRRGRGPLRRCRRGRSGVNVASADGLLVRRSRQTIPGRFPGSNSSQISDGSAALLFMSVEKAKSLKLNPIAKVHIATLAGANPVIMLTAPIPATQKALKRSGLKPEGHRGVRSQRGRSRRCRWPG
jgi:hypothetical protein